MKKLKREFLKHLKDFADTLTKYVSTPDNQWTIKGFIDIFQNIYTISSDTKIVSKVLEIHLFPKFLEFANKHNYKLVLAEKQNWYPDISFVSKKDNKIKFAVDLKTTYRLDDYLGFCNGFTLGSHGEYFISRSSTKNIQFPYDEYLGHYCLGILYTRTVGSKIDETKSYHLKDLKKIISVIEDFQFFACVKWTITSDKSGSGNTANIGSIDNIDDILKGNGVFKNLGEKWFDDYWMNYGKITTTDNKGKTKKITDLPLFLKYRGK
ncbi:MAG: EcoRV family type II restriction endonuclease, partial [Bacteroidetes bacterium]|nr:EcoRV family type II restriction endonuclease [Bacteroidota bacterium]